MKGPGHRMTLTWGGTFGGVANKMGPLPAMGYQDCDAEIPESKLNFGKAGKRMVAMGIDGVCVSF